MPLSELIRHFNGSDPGGDGMLNVEDGRVAAWANGLRLGSFFRPGAELRTGRIVGHRALLAAQGEDGEQVSVAEVYARATTPESVVRLDRTRAS